MGINPQKKKLEQALKLSLPPLIKALQDGDSSKKEEFAVLLFPYIKILVRKFSRSLEEDPSSIAGEVIVKLITKIKLIDLNKSVLGFIARTSINYCIDALNSKKVKMKGHINRGEKPLYGLIEDSDIYSNLSDENIDFYIASNFSEVDAQIVALYFIDQKSLSEISAITGQSEQVISETIELLGEQ